MSPFVTSCVDAFRDAYARTGMNLVQSMVVVAVGAVRWGGRKLGEDRRKRIDTTSLDGASFSQERDRAPLPGRRFLDEP